MNIWLIHYTNKDMKYFRRDKNMCEKLNFKIDGQWFTDFIRRLYYSENKSYKECKEKLLKSLCLDYISEDDKEELAQSIIFGDKKFIGINDLDLVDDVDFDVYKYSRIPRPTFIENKGITGILLSDGIFAQCKYGEHDDTINFVDNGHGNLSGAIIFSVGCEFGIGINSDSYVEMDTICGKLSKYQVKWYKKHKKYLNKKQICEFERYLDKNNKLE